MNFRGSESILVSLDCREHKSFWVEKGLVRPRGKISKALKSCGERFGWFLFSCLVNIAA